MAADNHTLTEERPRRHRLEGPQKHVIAFIFSVVLTLLAFALVMSGEMNETFIYIMLVTMAILQVIIQMAFWMHMKDRGHLFPIIGIFGGAFVAFTCVIMALYWVWW
ncbi:cytochrome C oxidase subunit IV family protein [Paenibacillus cisolokensis]|jgi:cytochrome c oxidase subunit 4|uniref:cytochrome C oxidase subunit IV family protein n=1 Tax=Paenibacillus TaxID=44249 RepID=UPI00071EC81B|nr:cytochrome C oxidase subunit IV family protein [Paenibacillus sp. 32O-W]ALS29815.1 subunit IV of cytochrome C oxidase [Paenibacillus sp. 32O-W]